MLLSGVLFTLFLAGCWLYCLTDAVLLPAEAFPGWSRRTWIAVIAATFIVGAAAWIIARWSWRARNWPAGTLASITWYPDRPSASAAELASAADAALARHPAGRSRAARPSGTGRTVPKGPDDDPEFLRQLDRRIRGE